MKKRRVYLLVFKRDWSTYGVFVNEKDAEDILEEQNQKNPAHLLEIFTTYLYE